MKCVQMYGVCTILGLITSAGSAQISPKRAADSVEMVASLDLGLNEPVSPADYELAMYLLDMGLGLDPSDADLARSVVEAAWGAGDHDAMIEATRSVIRNDPRDTVAQLRLISGLINREQTVEGRLEAYERFIGDGAGSIHATVRSRLMLDKALLERERGNEPGFLSALRGAAKLDTANKEAQSLVSQHYSRTIKETSTLMRLQLRVLYADPLDPHVHITIARMCAAEGATDAAWRFLNNGITIYTIDTGLTPAIIQEQQLSLLWQYEGPQAILDSLNPQLADERAMSTAQIEARVAADEPYDDITPPEDLRYGEGIDEIRLLAAYIIHDQETVDSVLLDLKRGLADYNEEMEEMMQVRGANRTAILGAFLNKVVSYQTMRAIVGVDHVLIARDIDTFLQASPEFETFFRPFEPFSKYAAGDYQGAIDAAYDRLSESSPRDLLIALSTEKLGKIDEAVELYVDLTHNYPLMSTGALARSRLAELMEGRDLRTEEGIKMQALADGVPEWFDKMIRNPENTLDFQIEPTKTSYLPGEETRIRIRVSNQSTLPLSLGSSHPIDSNVLVVPGFREIDGDFVGVGRSNVVDMGRRFRLEPLEDMVIEVQPDAAQTRWLLQNQQQSVIRQRWRALQGFQPGIRGGLINSPFSLVSETQLVERQVLGESIMPVDGLIKSIMAADETTFVRGVLGASAVLLKPGQRGDLVEGDLERIVEALWDRYSSGDTTTRVWMLGTLPVKLAAPALKSFDQRVQQSLVADSLIDPDLEPVLVAMVLMTRIEAGGSPALDIGLNHSDPRIAMIARTVFQRIDNLEPMYAGVDNPFEAYTRKIEENFGY